MYKCFRCGFSDEQKNNVIRHLNRKKECETKLSILSRTCCIDIVKTEDYKKLSFLLLEEIEKLKKSNVTNNDGTVALGNNNIQHSHNNIYNIEIKINSYENTDYSILKDNIHTCIKDGKVDESKLIKLLHFNKDKPENHNIKIENKRENRILTYNGEKFEDTEYAGKEGIWNFAQNVLIKTEEDEINDDNEILNDSLEKTSEFNENINTFNKRNKINKIQSVLCNGKDIVNETHTKNLKT